jgi:hypothetical protein
VSFLLLVTPEIGFGPLPLSTEMRIRESAAAQRIQRTMNREGRIRQQAMVAFPKLVAAQNHGSVQNIPQLN